MSDFIPAELEEEFLELEKQERKLDILRQRKADYTEVFQSGAGQRVLQDLMKFCRMLDTIYHPNHDLTFVLIGRNEVGKRIADNANLSLEDLYRIAEGKPLKLITKTEETP